MRDVMTDACGIIFLDKPLGWTSRKAVNEVSRLFSVPGKKRIKAGHAGTLDPLATGMLPILLGDATRFAEMGLQAEKSYRVSFDLSYQTDTLDCEGKVLSSFNDVVSRQQLEAVLPAFRGLITQVPPIYSAIRIDGKRAHDLARKGQDVEMKAREVTIHQLDLIAFEYPMVTLEVSCSKGTYIRSLARDIGEKLSMGGCVTHLRRLSTGGWPELIMVSMQVLSEQKGTCLVSLAQWLREFERVDLQPDEAKRFLQGQRIQLKGTTADTQLKDETVAVFADDSVIGTGLLKAGLRHMVLHPARILPSAQKRYL
ncbi:tRNA pseudouridine(55) synthase TruB [Mariprofundus sp. EBB-1]|uniref:tRNA pseudouridine(55) synthase TruB n=1 Tax=Mariprofundus sp. EBB-1 TaxID=2650971 RepID=UPI000EF219EB|nr:tRNA pseudouridine(55) synthase TruB [Mariprofundus sp. EBB-1]RLL55541.1 tRNA pseudouridine(55) synthase TruB [Mariprofundus sp. EBB-1]